MVPGSARNGIAVSAVQQSNLNKKMKIKNMTTLHLRKSIGRLAWRRDCLPIMVALAWFALSPTLQAVSPAPDGGYPNGNTAEGTNALHNLTTGNANTAVGQNALHNTTKGGSNTATGAGALFFNIGDGVSAGNNNTASGGNALNKNTTGSQNTAVGVQALFTNSDGTYNTATGYQALFSNTHGSFNTATGLLALSSNTSGTENTATGDSALFTNTTGSFNIALGFGAGDNITTTSNNIDIGNTGVAGDANTIRIGTVGTQTAAFIAGIDGVNEGGTISTVTINSNGQLGTQPPPSSRRFKKEIRLMDKVSEAVLALKPVTFQFKSDSKGTRQFGLIAEEVANVNPDLVVRDSNGEIYSVRYDAVNAMLLNEFLKEHKAFVEEQHKVEKLEATVTNLVATVKEQAAQIQKVSAQIEVSKPAPQTVLNNQ
jgi:hypothetical protein